MKEISQHNNLSFARYRMTTFEKDLMYIIISKLKKEDNASTEYLIKRKEFNQMTNTNAKTEVLKKSCKLLAEKTIQIKIDNDIFHWINIFQSVKYDRGAMTFKLTEDIKPYLFDLKERFTVYSLKHALSLNSKYSKRLYEICCSWKKGHLFEVSIDELRKMFGIENELQQWQNLKQRCLNPAIDEINKKTDIEIKVQAVKENFSFYKLQFFVKEKK